MATLSALATALIISTAGGTTAAQWAAITALQRRAAAVQGAPGAAPVAAAAPSDPVAASDPSAGSGAGAAATDGSGSTASGRSDASAGATSTGDASASSGDTSTTQAPTTTTTTTQTTSSTTAAPKASKVKHVFLIALSTPSYDAAFGPTSAAHYLNRTLRPRGVLLKRYRTLGAAELPDYLALVSGQAPNPDTRAGCVTFAEFAQSAKPGHDGQVPGPGCVYPNTVLTVGDQFTSTRHQWGAYVEGMGAGKAGSHNCQHPDSGAVDATQTAGATGGYTTRRNPFVYFHSLLDLSDCMSDDKPLEQLSTDLGSAARTPNYVFVSPGLCHDGATSPCPGGLGGIAGADGFLAQWVPRILDSAAYKRDGALIVVFTSTATRPAGTGALLLSRYARAGQTDATQFDAYSVLRSVEDLFAFKPLAHAAGAKSLAHAALAAAFG